MQGKVKSNDFIGLVMASDYFFTSIGSISLHFGITKDVSNTFFMFDRFHALDTPNFGNLSLEGATIHLDLD